MKKYIAFLLALGMLLALSACAAKEEPAEPAAEQGLAIGGIQEKAEAMIDAAEAEAPEDEAEAPEDEAEAEADAVPEAEPEDEPDAEPEAEPDTAPAEETQAESQQDETGWETAIGTTEGNTYENALFGFGAALADDWYVANEEEKAELNGLTVDMLSEDEKLAELLENATTFMDFYAVNADGSQNMNINIEDIGLLNGMTMDEEGYVDASIETVDSALASVGLEDATVEKTTIPFAGEDRWAIRIHGILEDMDVYETVVIVKHNHFVASVTMTSFLEDLSAEMAEAFYPLG